MSRLGASRGPWLSDTHRTDRAAPMEIAHLLGPKRSVLAGLVKSPNRWRPWLTGEPRAIALLTGTEKK